MASAGTADGKPARPKGWRLLKVALSTRKSAIMLAFGFSSGLPFALLIGTLNAWLGDAKISLATIGVLSWIGLTYSFKFLWSPLVDRVELPLLARLGRRKSWILLCQAVLIASFSLLALTNPATNIGWFAIFAVIGSFASATQDIAVDAWRIDVADEEVPVELLSAIYQFGYRIASIVGGALALFLAARMSWGLVYAIMAALVLVVLIIATQAPDTERPPKGLLNAQLEQAGELNPTVRAVALAIVSLAWAWAIVTIGHFMTSMLTVAPGAKPPSVADFTKNIGPWIIAATVLVPLIVAATTNWLRAHGRGVQVEAGSATGAGRTALNHMYGALVSPLAELSGRLGWGVLIIIGFILTYALCYNIWSSFAFPFYLDYLKYTKDEVAFASKIFGIIMTMIGISLGGYLFGRLGKFPTVLIGAAVTPFGNLVYADLADGGPVIDTVARVTGLTALGGLLGADERIVRLLMAISYENIATGIALTAFVAYLSGVVSKKFTAVQYSLLSSLTFLVGSLGRGVAGEAFDKYGYALVFRWTATAGLIAVAFVLLEWARVSARERRERALQPADEGAKATEALGESGEPAR
ncbi:MULTISPECIES: AmpG family muropeptide MFS transporter [Sphingomonas]|uniref:AmpG family muropeptide MFS transporter n=1 Tax=Sphingomonas TaxID=13687 RepID=UPI001F07A146|nr:MULTISPECIES: MFS transporter [Sphingomonas]